MRKVLYRLLRLLACIAPLSCTAQADSLFRVWNDPGSPDSSRIRAIQLLAWKAVFEVPDSGISLAQKQLELAERTKDRLAIYESHTTMAVGSSLKSDFPTALGHFDVCLRTARSMGDLKREANTYSNMSNVFRHMGDLPMALEQLQRSLRIDQDLGNKEGLAGTFNNIGNIHTELGDLPAALDHYTKSAMLYDALDQNKGRAQALLNLGVTHLEMGEREKALAEFLQSLGLYRTMGRKMEVGMALNNLGRTYSRLGRIAEARHSLDSALVLFTELDSKRQMARSLYYLGDLDLQEGHPLEAIVHCKRGLGIARSAGLALQRKECSECLMVAYEQVNDLGNAFRAQKEFMQVGDSLDALNNSEEVMRLEMQHSFREERIADSLKSERRRFADQLAYDQQLGKEREQRNIFLYSGLGVLLLAGSLWGRLRHTHRSRIAIQQEKDRSDALLHNILPEEVALELRQKGHAEAKHFEEVTILFTDFNGFT
ncbi:MAG: tetratricopeptide repeat protein, partial [Flavobacteriales bacterium]|nr:tetratricopeptide repeat protein [Flavobacteriales bacterium]